MNTAQLLKQSDARCNSGWTAGCGLSQNKRFVEFNSFLAHAWNYSHHTQAVGIVWHSSVHLPRKPRATRQRT